MLVPFATEFIFDIGKKISNTGGIRNTEEL